MWLFGSSWWLNFQSKINCEVLDPITWVRCAAGNVYCLTWWLCAVEAAFAYFCPKKLRHFRCRNLNQKASTCVLFDRVRGWLRCWLRIIGLVFGKWVLFLLQIPDPSHLCYSYEPPNIHRFLAAVIGVRISPKYCNLKLTNMGGGITSGKYDRCNLRKYKYVERAVDPPTVFVLTSIFVWSEQN